MHTNDANAQKTPYEIKMESEIVAPENRVEEKFMPPANDNFLKVYLHRKCTDWLTKAIKIIEVGASISKEFHCTIVT